ncbi:MAG: M56 family metallopeptidase [Planctomycetota bacterium]|jgi:beta-lactamase regulating signal transducer with metallopeptidase domain
MLEFLAQSTWADRIGWVLVHSLWQFALVVLLAMVLQRALQRRSATTRYSVLLAAMSMMVAVPVVTWFSPWSADAPAVAVKFRPVEKLESISPSQHVSPSQHGDDTMAMVALPAASPVELAAKPQPEPQRVEPAPIDLVSSLSLVQRRVKPWLPEIVLVWFAGVFVAAFRPLVSWYTVRRLRTAGVLPVEDAVHGVLERTAKRLRFARAVEVLQSTLVKTPVVVGYFRPAVLLPLCVVTGLPEVQLELILAHELAHIRRHDYLINLLQTLVETLFFYHPAVWWLSRQIRNERENCCDDVAMATVSSPADYGRALLAIEELRAAPTALSLGARGGSLLARIRRIAGCEPVPSVVGGGSVLGAILVSVAIVGAATLGAAPAEKKPAADSGSDSEVDRNNIEPSAPRAITKPENKTGQFGVALSGKATDQDGGRFHLVRGNTTWLGSDGVPLVYDDYDKNCYMSWGAHVVVLPKHAEGFFDFYGQRTLSPGVGRMDICRVHWASGQPANTTMPGAIDLPTYQLLLQPSVQQALNLSEEQRTKLKDISASYWPERRQIAGKALADMESISQREMAVENAKAGREGSVQSSTGPIGGNSSPFSKEVVEKLERQWSSARKQIEDVLTPEQLRTLKDLTFRTFAFGSGVMFEPEVLGRLGVAKNQQDELRALELQLQKEKDRRLRSVTREKIRKMLAVLTPQQQSQLREKHSLDKHPETDCSYYPYPGLPSHMPDTGAAEELGFSAEQRERVRKIVTAHWTSLGALQQEEQKLPLEDEKARKAIGEKRRQEMADLRTQIEAALTPEQWASCKEMAFQNLAIPTLRRVACIAQLPNKMGLTERLGMAVYIAQVSSEMGLTEQQRTALREIEAEYVDKPEQIYCELTDKALTAFTPAQQEKLRAEVDRRGW